MDNSTTSPGGFLAADNLGGFGYGVGISVGILLLITTITLASYYCTRTADPAPQQRNIVNVRRLRTRPDGAAEGDAVAVDVGLDEATIKSYPRLLYSEVKLRSPASTASCCSICLADYKGHHELRMIPDCGHLFHHACIDPWLRMHPTCPVCRTSPMPTPMSTPLAEVVPLASRRD
ncbi:RING-H2 finger protein ATL70-like [Rhodamnia argentea]|uniref:RING-type E3 ubiquitin transferase n=1 Tax=Rhodamnia argentea TaxID=178133 RepID=A0A8B8R2X3_9MYRT|nr:RING-H2 finger protein ATL70-like [Rhodamnia argentea]